MKRNAHDDANNTKRQPRRFTRPLLLALLTSSIAGVAHAQSIPPPPTQASVDENGVDVISGAIYLSSPSISVGQPGAGGLAYQRTYDSDIQGWRDNVTGTINVDTAGTTFTVTLLGVSEEFTLANGVFTSSEGRGGTLTLSGNIYTYTNASGVVALYDKGLAGAQPTQANEGRVTQMTLPSGERLSFTYVTLADGGSFTAQRLQSVTNNLGYQLAFEYQSNNADATGIQLKRVVALNNAVDYCAPTANGCSGLTQNWMRLDFGYGTGFETVTDVLGRTMRYAITSGRITGVRWPSSATDNITIAYNSSDGNVVSVSNGTGTWNYTYQIAGSQLVTTVVDPASDVELYESNLSIGRVTQFQNGEGNVTRYNYDGEGRLTSIIDSLLNYRAFVYDARGNITLVREFANSLGGVPGGVIDVYSATYAAGCANPVTCNLPTSTTDAMGNVTNYTYDATHGGVLTVTAPDPDGAGPLVRPQTRYTYAQLSASYIQAPGGSPTTAPSAVYRLTGVSACATTSSCANGADETKTTIAYSTNNLLPSSVSSGAGNGALTVTAASTYDSIGNLLTVDGPLVGNADTTRYRYDAGRQSVGVVGPDPDGGGALKHRALRFAYNSDGQVISVERGTVNSQSDSDWAAFASLETQSYGYDTLGRRVRESFVAGGTTHAVVNYSYDNENKLECIAVRMNPAVFGSLPASACTLSTAGAAGPDRIVRTLYDNADRVVQVQSAYGTPLQQTTLTQTYTANGEVATVTDARGNTTAYEYDGIDRLIKVRYPNPASAGASTTDFEQFSYNNAGAVTQRRLRDGGLVNFSYDGLMRVTVVDAPSGTNDVSYAYDNFSRLTQSVAGGQTLSFAYDQLSRLTSASSPLGAVGYQYDLAGRQTRITWPDAFYAAYEYDVVGALTAVRENGAASGPGVLALYTYDDLGRRVSITRGNGVVTTYAYDSASRLDGLSHDLSGTGSDLALDFSYNSAGQIVARDRTSANPAYVYPQPGINVDVYASNNRNQITSIDGAALTYDARGNLTGAGGVSYSYDAFNRLTAAGPLSLAYDPAGRLYETTASGATTRFLYDGLQAIAEYNTAGVLQRRYVPGAGLDEHLVWYEGSGTSDRRWMVQDERGSVVAVSDGTGAVLSINSYDEYGQPASGNIGAFGYTGQMYLSAAGLYHYRMRAYSPALGRFLQTDPIGMAGGMNLYAYVGNDPINWLDPLGLCTTVPRPPMVDAGGGRDCYPIPPVNVPTAPSLPPRTEGQSGRVNDNLPSPNDPPGLPGSYGNFAGLLRGGTSLPWLGGEGGSGGGRVQEAQSAGPVLTPRPTPWLLEPPPIAPRPTVPYPTDPLAPPGPGWVQRGPNWYNPHTGESLRPDLSHPPPVGPHYDYHLRPGPFGPGGSWRWYPDGRFEPKAVPPVLPFIPCYIVGGCIGA
jgi:RHS repeat-associated protein